MKRKSDFPTTDYDEEISESGGSYRITIDKSFLELCNPDAKNENDILADITYCPPFFILKVENPEGSDTSDKTEKEEEHRIRFQSGDPVTVVKNELKSPYIAGKKKLVIDCDSGRKFQVAEDVLDKYREVRIADKYYRLVKNVEVDSENKIIEFQPAIPEIDFEKAVEGIREYLKKMSVMLSGYLKREEMVEFRNSGESFEDHLIRYDEPIDILWMCLTAEKKTELSQPLHVIADLGEKAEDGEKSFSSEKVITQLIATDKLERIGDRMGEMGSILDELVDSNVRVEKLVPFLEDVSDYIEGDLWNFLDITCNFVLGEISEQEWRDHYQKIREPSEDITDKRFSKHFEKEKLEKVSGAYRVMVKILKAIFRDAVAIFRWEISV